MASNQTENFSLNQWALTDDVVMADFNADNAKIDAALTAVKAVTDTAYTTQAPPFAAGAYTGDGAAQRRIELPFTPRAVLVMSAEGRTYHSGNAAFLYGGLAVTGSNAALTAAGRTEWVTASTAVAITEGGFLVGYSHESSYAYTNAANTCYHYIALR